MSLLRGIKSSEGESTTSCIRITGTWWECSPSYPVMSLWTERMSLDRRYVFGLGVRLREGNACFWIGGPFLWRKCKTSYRYHVFVTGKHVFVKFCTSSLQRLKSSREISRRFDCESRLRVGKASLRKDVSSLRKKWPIFIKGYQVFRLGKHVFISTYQVFACWTHVFP